MMKIPFDKNWSRVAVSVSGGADSALLAYLVCKEITTQEVHIISHIRCWKTKPWQETDAKRVYAWVETHFPDINFQRHVNFIAPELEYGSKGPTLIDEYGKQVSGDNIQQRAYAEYICHKHDIDCYYNGVTRNPRDTEFSGMDERNIERTEDNKHLEFMQHMGRYAAHPFRFISKDQIIQRYYDEGITDLLDITRSCEGVFEGTDYETYKPGDPVPICGECFWCLEREWALGEAE